MRKRDLVIFSGPRLIEVRSEPIAAPGRGEVLVQTDLSAISAGTEMLLFRGEIPSSIDDTADTVSQGLHYPTSYGYSAAGTVVELGSSVDDALLGRRVVGFCPHASAFISRAQGLLPVPDDLTQEDAVFLPNAETAVNIVQDAAPILGERVLVLGQGVVGLLTVALLRGFPLERLVTADVFAPRREASEGLGVDAALDPRASMFRAEAIAFTGPRARGFDLVIDLTGNPSAVNDAIALTTFSGRIIVASWFGTKTGMIDMGGAFHRSRIKIAPSQVSTIAPELSGRWDKSRRFGVAWDALRRIHPAKWITQRFPVANADEAYRLLDESPEGALQVLIQYV